MDDKIFFKYYIPALKQALLHDNEIEDYSVKSPSWYYPENIDKELMLYEDSHYDEFPFLEKVAYYFHAVYHNFPTFEGMDINDFKNLIVNEMLQLEKKYLTCG